MHVPMRTHAVGLVQPKVVPHLDIGDFSTNYRAHVVQKHVVPVGSRETTASALFLVEPPGAPQYRHVPMQCHTGRGPLRTRRI